MNTHITKGPFEVITVGLGPDEKLLESITEAAKKHDIKHGAVVSGVGTLKRTHLHYVNTSGFPPDNRYYVIDDPVEVGSISGLIVNYEPHLHIDVGCRDNETYIGHLENESIVLYLAEVCILKFNDMKQKRENDPRYNLSLLGPQD